MKEGVKVWHLTLKKRIKPPVGRGYRWLAVCKCGKEIEAKESYIRGGMVRSCGNHRSDLKERYEGEVVGAYKLLQHIRRRRWWVECINCGSRYIREIRKTETGKYKACKKCKSSKSSTTLIGKEINGFKVLSWVHGNTYIVRCKCGKLLKRKHRFLLINTHGCGYCANQNRKKMRNNKYKEEFRLIDRICCYKGYWGKKGQLRADIIRGRKDLKKLEEIYEKVVTNFEMQTFKDREKRARKLGLSTEEYTRKLKQMGELV